MAATLLDIAEVAAHSGLAPSALRFYEQRGLIASAGRNGLRRTYHPEVLSRLEMITCAREAGFSIAEIARFTRATPRDAGIRASMARKADELEDEIARLIRMREALRHATTCTHEVLVDCPDFKSTLTNPTPRADRAPRRRTGAR
ncbi:MerR family transcriptional regulator [Nocardia brasiliensis]|uniref:MerR family transcriptional regulator n=1 Tax=Nocardia brasiliensis TaxID=37326 RepID=A0A6G9Y154_NOCBR|nr:MerR family transcriptional regulator [Nocardia brasiliensis]QIS06932.1 MerR family transcriptional regulator [Nocardia brasiliensis]